MFVSIGDYLNELLIVLIRLFIYSTIAVWAISIYVYLRDIRTELRKLNKQKEE